MKYNQIRVYGDSFVASWEGNTLAWAEKLGKKLETNVINLGISGSSLESTLKNVQEDVANKNIKKKNAVIILFTTPNRFYNKTVLENFPEVGTLYLHNHLLQGDSKEYYDKYKDKINWWFSELDFELEKIRVNCYIHGLANLLSKKYYETDFFFIFNTVQPWLDLHGLEDLRDNFHIISEFGLNELSMNEIDADKGKSGKYFEFTKTTTLDPRVNHLTEKNQEILIDQMYRYMITKDKSVFDKNAYYKKIISPIHTLEHYYQEINNGNLLLQPKIIERLK